MEHTSWFTSLAKQYDGTFQKTESKWYNGHTYLPLYRYQLNLFLGEACQVEVCYEHRQSEFNTSSKIDGGAFSDRHLYSISASLNKVLPKFVIKSKGWFRILLKGSQGYTVKCRDPLFKQKLEENTDLKALFAIGIEDGEFDPMLDGTGNSIVVNFGTKFFIPELIQRLIHFISEVQD